jgi:hypothetical protein
MIPSAVRAKSPRVGTRASRAWNRFELVLDDGEIGAGLIGLTQREAGAFGHDVCPKMVDGPLPLNNPSG